MRTVTVNSLRRAVGLGRHDEDVAARLQAVGDADQPE